MVEKIHMGRLNNTLRRHCNLIYDVLLPVRSDLTSETKRSHSVV